MALETSILEFPFRQGQDEGTERAVLPVGEFSALRNARFRKVNLIGKRNGYAVKTSVDSAGNALGSGGGRLQTLGPDFCVVDDRFYRRRDLATDQWAPPTIGTAIRPVLADRFPLFTPGPTIVAPTQENALAAADACAGMTTALGYIWVAEGRANTVSGTWSVHVTAFDPATSKAVWQQDISTAVAITNVPGVQLLSTSNDVVALLIEGFTGATKTSVNVYWLSILSAGFTLGGTFVCASHAANYATTSAGDILFIHTLTGSPATLRIGFMNPITTAITAGSTTYAVGGNKALLSCFQQQNTGQVRIGFTDAVGPTVFVLTYSSALALAGTDNWTAAAPTAQSPVLFAERGGANTSVVSIVRGTNRIHERDINASGALSGFELQQLNVECMSQPFTVFDGTQYPVCVWVRYRAGENLGVATLLRVPQASEYAGSPTITIWPAQATLDTVSCHTALTAATAGPPFPTPLATTVGQMSLLNYTRETYVAGGVTQRRRSFLLVPVWPRSYGLRYAASCVVPCCGRQFIAAAQPMWSDSVAVYEAGFIQAPLSVSVTPAGGGALTAGATYSYTAIFQSSDSGMVERSAPALPVTQAMGANTQNTLVFTTLETGYRKQVACRIYRTLANGSVFQFVGEADATPGVGVAGTFTFVDQNADADVSQNETLYINIGQELAAANFPACRFANVGGNRLWLGGCFTGNIVQASKQFMPRMAPEFADDDAFRVTLPSDCTGSAWLDAQVLFTQEGIYVVNGDGPDQAGVGFFTLSRLPFDIGCIDWRSVDATDAGIFFQSARGLYLLPRGFGTPVSMNQVLDTLSTYPVITSARSSYSSQGGADNSEQIVQWTAVDGDTATAGVVITFDMAYQAFSIDTCNADYPATFQAGWGGDAVQAPESTLIGPGGASKWHPFRVRGLTHDDGGLAIDMSLETGDIRPWGMFAHGVINRVGVFARLGSACTLTATKVTDRGTAAPTTRTYTGVAPDPVPDQDVYLDVELGSVEQRDVTALRVTLAESSATEGLAFIGLVIETDKASQGFKLLSKEDRVV